MKKYTDLMLDIETLGTGPGCVLISIAAVPFCKDSGEIGDKYYHHNIDIDSCLKAGLKIDPNTLHWWIQKASLFTFLTQNTYAIKGALESLRHFIPKHCTEDVRVWGKGPSFDNAILRYCFDLFEMKLPWRYSRERCVRTDLDGHEEMLKQHLPFEGREHHPVYDAKHQIASMLFVRSVVPSLQNHELD